MKENIAKIEQSFDSKNLGKNKFKKQFRHKHV